MPDSRVEKLTAHWLYDPSETVAATLAIQRMEAAGLVVIDPDDEATIARLADSIYDHEWFGVGPEQDVGRGAVYRPTVEAILAALAVKPS